MDVQLSGKRALVTGSSTGLGQAIALMLAAEGATVVVHGRNEARARQVTESIRQAGGQASYVVGDLATDQDADAVVASALADGPIAILVNNAGSYQPKPWLALSAQDWANVYNNNVVSGIRMIQRLLPQMRELGWGRIIQVGGTTGIQPMALQPDYNASIAARHNLAVSLARELKGSGITSNTVAPGAMLVDTTRAMLMGMAQQFGWGDDWAQIEQQAIQQFVQNDVGRFGKPEEVAAAVTFLASSHADFIHGSIIRVDGGQTLSV